VLASGARPALLYAIPDGHNPLGVSMPVESRRRLTGLAREHGVPIIEDDAYGLLVYDAEDRPALRAFDPDWVFHVGSFSKTLAPALRTGWVVVPERFVGPLAALKESSDIDTATIGQRAVASFVASEDFDGHLARLRTEYAQRRDTLLSALERAFKGRARWSHPRAGFFTWVELEGGIDAERLLEVALERERVAFVPGAAFAAPGAAPARSALRLNFSYNPPEVLEDSVRRLARALDAVVSSPDLGMSGGTESRRG
jgi:2-aminoadipate transaminase